MAIELIAKIAPKNDGFTGMVDADQVIGGSNLPNTVGHTEWDAAYTHVSSDGTDHTYIDQDLKIAASPTFANVYVPDEGYVGATGGSVGWTFDTAGDISTTADVGINTTEALAPLDVRGKLLTQGWLHINNTGFVNAGFGDARAVLVFGATDDEEAWLFGAVTSTTKANTALGIYNWGGDWRQVWLPNGNVGIGITGPLAKCHIDQSSITAAIPVLTLDQADVSDGFINFIGSDRGSISDLFDPIHSVRVELNGTVYRIGLYFDA